MKKILLPALLSVALLPLPAVAAGSYHVTEGFFGEVTFSGSGSCPFGPLSYRNAWFGELLDESDQPVGWGIITASGELLVFEEDYAPLSYVDNKDTGVGKDITYTSFVGPELAAMIESQSGCAIRSIEPDTASRNQQRWDDLRGRDQVRINARYKGFNQEVCQVRDPKTTCKASGFSGSIQFRGDWAVPG